MHAHKEKPVYECRNEISQNVSKINEDMHMLRHIHVINVFTLQQEGEERQFLLEISLVIHYCISSLYPVRIFPVVVNIFHMLNSDCCQLIFTVN